MTHVTITKCQCGHASCGYHGLSNGSFDQGNGFDKETAERYAALWNSLEGVSNPPAMPEAVEALIASTEWLEAVLTAMDKYNEAHGTYIIGPSLLGSGKQVAHNRAILSKLGGNKA